MKIGYKQSRIVVIVIALIFIVFGILDGVFKFNIDPKLVQNISYILMLAAAAIFFMGRKSRTDSGNTVKSEEKEDNTEEQQ